MYIYLITESLPHTMQHSLIDIEYSLNHCLRMKGKPSMCSEFRYELQQCPCPAQWAQDTHIMTYQSLYFYTYIHNLPSVYSPYRDLKCLKTLPLVTAGELSSGAVKCGRQLRRWIKQDLRTVNNLYPFPMINLYCFLLLCHKLVIPGALVTYNLTFLG